MTGDGLRDLARRAGIADEWTTAAGATQAVTPDVLRQLLDALGFPCRTPSQIAESNERLRQAAAVPPPLVTATAGAPIILPQRETAGRGRLVLEDGTRRDVALQRHRDRIRLVAKAPPGYHQLHLDDRIVTLAIAPQRCFAIPDIATQPLWGLAVQLYGLRRHGDGGIGDAGALCAFVAAAARVGADAVALSPTHALFGADRSRYGPYSPSSRLFFNPLHADPRVLFGEDRVAAAIGAAGLTQRWAALEDRELIDWPAAAEAKFTVLASLFDGFQTAAETGQDRALVADFAAFRQAGGNLLEQHARFEVLHAAQLARSPGSWSWRMWPATWRDPQSAAVGAFAAEHARDVTFHAFLQWVADRSLAAAQSRARGAGMRIGLIADLAVGMDGGGSHAWSRQHDVVVGLTVGAPPDLFNPAGQNWGLTTFSPRALVECGFEPFLATLRATIRHAGGVRIDHAMGMMRLWLIPEGATADQGAYLAYPLDDLLRLIALESHRHQAIIVGEDLGTVPEGFRQRLTDTGIIGVAVLWFERCARAFNPAATWPTDAAAMTSTHDLPTVAGWWRGTDIAARAAPDGAATDVALARQRAIDRGLLWEAFRRSGSADGEEPPQDPALAVDAAVRFIAATPSQLRLLPLEDALALADQPNVPGTVDEHPNWRRRYPVQADAVFDSPEVLARARSLTRRSRR
jgi:4-alpha-glucanotransferase